MSITANNTEIKEINDKNKTTDRDIFDDISMRFIINRVEFVELQPEQYFFVLEEAYWFATDFYKLRGLTLLQFAEEIMHHCGIPVDCVNDYSKFKAYKQSIKVFGTMLFSPDYQHVLLVEQANSPNNITFPKGKKSKDETGMECAVRETLEEVGYNAGNKIVDISVTVFDKITFYCVFNVDMQYPFKTRTRNEISKIFWFDLKKLQKYYEKKEYKIFVTAYRMVESRIKAIRQGLFKFDQIKIMKAVDVAMCG